jgi:hypothetical protein
MLKIRLDKRDSYVLLGIVSYFITIAIIAVSTKGTCDSGDSLIHFLFSKYAFRHPENFLDHWAKPLFVLLSAPFAQAGFVGMKLFNCCVAAFTAWFCYKTAKTLAYKHDWLAVLLLCFTPGYFIHIFSGLTEPLFALLLILGSYLAIKKNLLAAVCVISFLPFVRSEGLIVLGVFGVYLLLNKQYKYIPWLFTGHIVFGIAGAFYYHDLLWVFTKIPYAGSSGKYGHGSLSHFVIQLNYIIGIPLYFLLGAGLIKKTMEMVKKKSVAVFIEPETLLIYALFVSFIAAHTLFWFFGIFESMGLKRVLVAVVPAAVLIALKGYNFILTFFKPNTILYSAAAVVLAGVVMVFPFVPNPAAVNWERDLSLTTDEELVEEASNYLKSNFTENIYLYYANPYINLTMNRDRFSKQYNDELKNFYACRQRPKEYVVIWDSWFSVIENGISLESLKADPQLKLVKSFQAKDRGQEIQVAIFKSTN